MLFKHRVCFLLVGLVVFFSFSTLFPRLLISPEVIPHFVSSTHVYSPLPAFSNSYISHEPIHIDSDAELAALAVEGSGTETDPFILGGWNITADGTHGIVIDGTSKHFILQNCWVLVTYEGLTTNSPERSTPYSEYDSPPTLFGIQIRNTTNGTSVIRNNFCQTQHHGFGIYLWKANSSFVTNNSCFNNHYGIYISDSPSSKITNNTCNQNGIGFIVTGSRFCDISHNICDLNSLYGLYTSTSGSSFLTNNSGNANFFYGLYVRYCAFSVIINNTFNNQMARHGILLEYATECLVATNILCQNDEDGLHLLGSSRNTICWNLIRENQDFGIGFFGAEKYGDLCKDNLIHHNNFITNGGPTSTSQAFDRGFNSRYGWNYWSDYNGTGFYSIIGSAGAFDPHPLFQLAVSGTPVAVEADLTAPSITNVTRNPFSPTPDNSCVITATITDDSGITSVFLDYQVTSENLSLIDEGAVEMNFTSEDQYLGVIRSFPNGYKISYTIIAVDSSEFLNKARSKDDYSIRIITGTSSTLPTTTISRLLSTVPDSIPTSSTSGWFFLLPLFCAFFLMLRKREKNKQN